MKLIIDIPKYEYDFTYDKRNTRTFKEEDYVELILNGVPIKGMTNWQVLKSIFPYAEIVGGDETLTGIRIDSNPKVGTPIVMHTKWLNAPYSIEQKVRDI